MTSDTPPIIPEFRVGQGVDAHAFAEGRKLILGGVEIEHDRGLSGHSDADVLSHAITDAILGAAALGDIGHHFPDDDPTYKNADSIELLSKANRILAGAGWQVLNVDATIVAQAPRMAPHTEAMRERIAHALGVDVSRVSVKATTTERMGFTGREEGIAAMAVALIGRDIRADA